MDPTAAKTPGNVLGPSIEAWPGSFGPRASRASTRSITCVLRASPGIAKVCLPIPASRLRLRTPLDSLARRSPLGGFRRVPSLLGFRRVPLAPLLWSLARRSLLGFRRVPLVLVGSAVEMRGAVRTSTIDGASCWCAIWCSIFTTSFSRPSTRRRDSATASSIDCFRTGCLPTDDRRRFFPLCLRLPWGRFPFLWSLWCLRLPFFVRSIVAVELAVPVVATDTTDAARFMRMRCRRSLIFNFDALRFFFFFFFFFECRRLWCFLCGSLPPFFSGPATRLRTPADSGKLTVFSSRPGDTGTHPLVTSHRFPLGARPLGRFLRTSFFSDRHER